MEIRKLTKDELNNLIETAPKNETKNLIRILSNLKLSAYDFFNTYALESFGLVNSRPLYFCYLIQNNNGKKEMWTVVNSDVKEQFSLFKYAKKCLKKWITKHKEIYATMEKINPKSIRWTERLGFKRIKEDNNLIIFKFGG